MLSWLKSDPKVTPPPPPQAEPDGGVKPHIHSMVRDWAPWGKVADGTGSASPIYWTVVGDVKAGCDFITMTDGDGNPMRGVDGRLFRRRLEPNEDPQMVAMRWARAVRASIRGPEGLSGFQGPMIWPRINIKTAAPV